MAIIRASAGDWTESPLAHVIFVFGIASAVLLIPSYVPTRFTTGVLGIIGGLALWRYGWAVLNLVRANYYLRVAFPRLRAAAERVEGRAPDCWFLITSFRIPTDTTRRVFSALCEAANAAPARATIVASVVEMADVRLMKAIFAARCAGQGHVRLKFVRIPGTGKRDALAFGLRAICRDVPRREDLVALVDGDSILPPDLIERTASFFRLAPDVGALTTDERADVRGRAIFKRWYQLRFAQRHVFMSSNGLAGRVLTLTGRMSLFRADIATDEDFIRIVEHDELDHWRLGTFPFLTGDDKSTWFWLLTRGYRMLYVPDVTVRTEEEPPSPRFVESSLRLMMRWFGNVLRNNGRALALGPRRTGLFTFVAILDQRVSMWTGLASPLFAVMAGLFISIWAFPAYALWILASRYAVTLALLSVREQVSVSWPFLMYYNQVTGSFVKIFVLFHPDRQRWTRQNTAFASGRADRRATVAQASSDLYQTLALGCLVGAVALMLNLFEPIAHRGIP